jgi:septal ring factor EnvC (AmiA/AmiB activator)
MDAAFDTFGVDDVVSGCNCKACQTLAKLDQSVRGITTVQETVDLIEDLYDERKELSQCRNALRAAREKLQEHTQEINRRDLRINELEKQLQRAKGQTTTPSADDPDLQNKGEFSEQVRYFPNSAHELFIKSLLISSR